MALEGGRHRRPAVEGRRLHVCRTTTPPPFGIIMTPRCWRGRDGCPTPTSWLGLPLSARSRLFLSASLGAQKLQGRPVSTIGARRLPHGHLPSLWDEAMLVVAGRTAANAFASLLAAPNPFSSWSVHDRYEDGSTVTAAVVTSHLGMARQILGHLQNAKALGALR